MNEITQTHYSPNLSREEEFELARRYREENDLTAAHKLVTSHLRFVNYIAREYVGYGLPMEDIIQEGCIGLMKAVKRFDPSHGVRLISFAAYGIRGEICDYIIRNWRIVKVATTKQQRKLFFNLRSLKNQHTLTPSEIKNIADTLNVKPDEVKKMEVKLGGNDVCFDPIVADEDNIFSPIAYLKDQSDSIIQFEEQQWKDETKKKLFAALEKLDQRSCEIIKSRWLVENTSDRATLKELADQYNVSKERIRQIELSALKTIKESILDE